MRRFGLAAMGGSPGGHVFLVNESCDGTGTPAGWTNANGSPNWDYATSPAPLEGTQSLLCATNGVAVMTRTDFTNQDFLWLYFMMSLHGTTPGSTLAIGSFRPNGGGTPVLSFALTSAMKLSFNGALPSLALSFDTTYHVWIFYQISTGSNNGIADVRISTDGTRTLSGPGFDQITNSTQTSQIGRLQLGSAAATNTFDIIFDKIRISNTQIGDNGA